jgi:hypothetical protein
MHPLLDDISVLKDAEIESKVVDLSRKYWMANNPSVKHQISIILQMYQEELSIRRSRALNQQYQKRDKGLDDLIKVN